MPRPRAALPLPSRERVGVRGRLKILKFAELQARSFTLRSAPSTCPSPARGEGTLLLATFARLLKRAPTRKARCPRPLAALPLPSRERVGVRGAVEDSQICRASGAIVHTAKRPLTLSLPREGGGNAVAGSLRRRKEAFRKTHTASTPHSLSPCRRRPTFVGGRERVRVRGPLAAAASIRTDS